MTDEGIRLFHELADRTPAEREAYYAGHGTLQEVREEVESLLAFDGTGGDPVEERVAAAVGDLFGEEPALPAGGRCGPYRLVRLLGHGGMGAVYLADRDDGEVSQRVAIKFLGVTAGFPEMRDRFRQERQILASLTHPGIARLLDAGHSGGQPYLVMEYIEGTHIDEYAGKLGTHAILNLFLAICDAVSYAHRNLIIHRDLKPSNILIDSEGCPKLLDFGIAKILNESEETRASQRILTPEYASPEQALGGVQGTATDIYSLGAVLYRLLLGKAPGGPRTRASLRNDLDFILGKAMRPEPMERYASVDAFAGDIRAFLEHRPVEARKGSIWYRTRKFFRRYWLPAGAAAMAVCSLASGLWVANRERLAAQRRFEQVRQLANKLFDIDKQIRMTPGTTDARKLIVSTSLQYLEGLAADARGDKDLALDIGTAYHQLARIQGVPVNSNLGQYEQAEESLRRAADFLKTALRADRTNRAAQFTLAAIAHDRMVIAGSQGRVDEALAQARVAAATLDAYVAGGPLDENGIKDAGFLYGNIAVTDVDNRLFDDAIRDASRALEIIRPLASTGGQRSLALGIMAVSYRELGNLDRALEAIRESRRIQEQLTETHQSWQRANLALALWREGSILGEEAEVNLNREAEALAAFRRAFAVAEDLVGRDPSDNTHCQLAAEVGRRLGNVLRHSDPADALTAYDQALKILRQARIRTVPTRRAEAALLADSAYAVRALRRGREARQRIDEAFRLLAENKDYPAEKVALSSEADFVLRALASHLAEIGHIREGEAAYRELLGKIGADNPDPRRYLSSALSLSAIYIPFAALERRAGNESEAEALERLRGDLWRSWDARLPNNAFVRRQLAASSVSAVIR
jgi:serine/threonine protein kinase